MYRHSCRARVRDVCALVVYTPHIAVIVSAAETTYNRRMYSHLLNLKMLPILKETLGTIDNQREASPTTLEIRNLLARRLEQVEQQIRSYEQSAIALT